MTKVWNADAARAQYAIAHWGEGYFDVAERGGDLVVRPRGADGPGLSLPAIVDAAHAAETQSATSFRIPPPPQRRAGL